MKIRPVGAELLHADGQTDITKLTVALCNFANAPKNGSFRKFICWLRRDPMAGFYKQGNECKCHYSTNKQTFCYKRSLNCSIITSSSFFLLLLFIKRYNLFKVLACSTTFFQLSLLCYFLPIGYIHVLYIFQNVTFPTCFRSSNWSFRHGCSSLNPLHNIIFNHAFKMA
jgi:hypothetical protein